MNNTSSFYKNFFHCHKNTPCNTVRFRNEVRPSSPASEMYIVLTAFMTMEKVLVNAAGITNIMLFTSTNNWLYTQPIYAGLSQSYVQTL